VRASHERRGTKEAKYRIGIELVAQAIAEQNPHVCRGTGLLAQHSTAQHSTARTGAALVISGYGVGPHFGQEQHWDLRWILREHMMDLLLPRLHE
jgi:hypothetical protein